MLTRLAALALASSLSGCAESPPTMDPLDYLAAGVDPDAEAERAALQLARAGFVVDERVEGGGAVALAARRLRDGATAVRLITRRGVVLGLDVPDSRYPERRAVRLPRGAAFVRRELDGHFELPIEVVTHVRCVAVILVDAAGFARELTRDENPYSNEGCYPEADEAPAEAPPALEEGDEIIDGASPGSAGAPAEG